MTKYQWIKEKLKEHNNQVDKVYSLFPEYQKLFPSSHAKEKSYRRRVREISQFLVDSGKLEKEEEAAKPVSDNMIVDIIADFVKENKRKPSVQDIKSLALQKGFPVSDFYKVNVKLISENVFQLQNLHIQEEIKEERYRREIDRLKKDKKMLMELATDTDIISERLGEFVTEYERYEPPVIYIPQRRKREAAICLSDTHFDEIVSKSETLGINEFTPEIAKKRIEKVFSKSLEWTQELNIPVLHIKILGDLVSGIIHQELLENSELGATEAVLQLSDFLAQCITDVSKYYQKITVLGLSGNHGRFFQKPFYKKKQTLNYDYFLYEFLKRSLKGVVEEFVLPESFFWISSILDSGFLSLHGDIFKGGTGLNPVSGTIGRDISRLHGLLRQHHKDFEYAEFGHFHHGESIVTSFDGVIVLMNGSLIGGNEFSIGAVKRAERPSQNFYVVEEGGGVLFKNNIYLD